MNLRKCGSTIFLLVMVVFLNGCNAKNQGETEGQVDHIEIAKQQMILDLENLTSKEYEGRRPGTEGNIKATKYIAERYSVIGLAPFKNGYEQPYKKPTENVVDIDLKLLEDDVVINEFIYGKDYVEIFLDDVNIELPLVKEPSDYDCAVLVDKPSDVAKLRMNEKVKLILQRNIKSLKRSGYFYHKNITPQIALSSESYDSLMKSIGETISFQADIQVNELEQSNVAAMIKGKNSDHSFIISAHFDSMGSIGDSYWPGALDNASGVSTLLSTAQYLKDFYKDEQPPYDIIFCAFNSEETISNSEAGSIEFHNLMQEAYQSVMLLNLDCLGNMDQSSLLIVNNDSEASQQITSDMMDYFQSISISVDHGEKAFMSDHISFEHGITLTTLEDLGSSNIHTQDDTYKDVDIDYLLIISKELANYISREMDYQELVHEMNQNVIKDEEPSPTVEEVTEGPVIDAPFSLEEFETRIGKSFGYEEKLGLDIYVNRYREKSFSDDKILTLQDIRSFYYMINGFESIHLYVYSKDIADEILAYDMDRESNQLEESDLEFLVSIDNLDYHITELKDHSRVITSTFENDDYIILATIYVYPDEDSVEAYKQSFMERIPSEYISKTIEVLTE